MDVISILAKKRQEVTSFEVKVHADRQEEHPKCLTTMTIEYVLGEKTFQEKPWKERTVISGKILPGSSHVFQDRSDRSENHNPIVATSF